MRIVSGLILFVVIAASNVTNAMPQDGCYATYTTGALGGAICLSGLYNEATIQKLDVVLTDTVGRVKACFSTREFRLLSFDKKVTSLAIRYNGGKGLITFHGGIGASGTDSGRITFDDDVNDLNKVEMSYSFLPNENGGRFFAKCRK